MAISPLSGKGAAPFHNGRQVSFPALPYRPASLENSQADRLGALINIPESKYSTYYALFPAKCSET